MLPLDQMSLKSRTETSAKWWQEKEGGSQHQIHISHILCIDTLTCCFKPSIVQSFPIVIIEGLDDF